MAAWWQQGAGVLGLSHRARGWVNVVQAHGGAFCSRWKHELDIRLEARAGVNNVVLSEKSREQNNTVPPK